ncbi:DinB family protein [Isoptericola sp. CG 20/1183]|uniref:DinB family protein n=1 Tax=Isoptericola halotolerans TaxID=300560 RepID=A0ABX5EKE7_9MICO|nr:MULTISPECIES: DinB family protein [Isoptericola]PRZ09339.1 DinB family protein [Isoptericola sp. CG 20/1183]PRZ10140.1 DinB family protein [Isoptericola halotolerans]
MTDDTGGRETEREGIRDGIVPDTKDWTWVIERPCDECGFDPTGVDPLAVGDAVRATVPAWQGVLARPEVRRRPAPGVWSPLEYAAHVRDVFRVFDERLALMLATDGAAFPNWDQDAAAVAGGYAQADPAVVATELADAAGAVADRFDTVRADQLERVGQRSNGSTFTVRTFGRYFLHDVVHHLHDVRA